MPAKQGRACGGAQAGEGGAVDTRSFPKSLEKDLVHLTRDACPLPW